MNDIKKDDEIFCPECGKPIKRDFTICPYCRNEIKKTKTEKKIPENFTNKDDDKIMSGKTKMTAVFLVIFLGLFGWLYTWKKSAAKFLITFFGLLIISGIYSTIQWFPLIVLFPIAAFGVWLWAIIDTATKPESFYTNYPNKKALEDCVRQIEKKYNSSISAAYKTNSADWDAEAKRLNSKDNSLPTDNADRLEKELNDNLTRIDKQYESDKTDCFKLHQ